MNWRPDVKAARNYARGRLAGISFATVDLQGRLDKFHGGRKTIMASTFKAMANLAAVLIAQGKLADAEPLAIQGAAGAARVLDARHPDAPYTASIHAWYLYAVDRSADAEPLYRRIVADATEVLGAEHPHRLYWLSSLAWCLLESGHLDEAERLFRDALAAQR